MSISGIDNYNRSNYYDVKKVNEKSKTEESSFTNCVKKAESSAEGVDTQKYLGELQKKNQEINIMYGNKDISRTKNSNSKTDVIIAPFVLKQMASDPEAARKYEKMLAEIPALDKWADAMISSMTGSEVKYRQVWIDEDGNMGSFCITGPSEEKIEAEKKKEQQKEQQKELMERLKANDINALEAAYLKSIKKLMSVDYKV